MRKKEDFGQKPKESPVEVVRAERSFVGRKYAGYETLLTLWSLWALTKSFGMERGMLLTN